MTSENVNCGRVRRLHRPVHPVSSSPSRPGRSCDSDVTSVAGSCLEWHASGHPWQAGGWRVLRMTARGTPSRFLQSVLQNGLGRYVCQLKRLNLIFSKDAQPSRGAREFIEEKVVDFAKQNPGIVIYISPKPCRVPKLVGEYLNGSIREEDINSKTSEEIAQLIQKMARQSGLDIIRIRKPYHTDNPSIQGQWHPFTNKSTTINLQSFDADSKQTGSQ